jgi:hypothetical protein
MTASGKPKPKPKPATRRKAKHAEPRTSWGDAMKKALKDKQVGRQGPEQPKPRDSGTFKVKKDSL